MRALDIGLLRPRAARPREHVHRARRLRRVVALVAVDLLRRAVLGGGADRQRVAVAAQRDREAELVAVAKVVALAGFAGVRGLDVRLLRPGGAGAGENVDGASLRHGVVVLIAVDAGCGARFPVGADGHRIAVAAQRDGRPEMIALPGVGRLDVRLLRPGVALTDEDVDSARRIDRIVVLVAVDAPWRRRFQTARRSPSCCRRRSRAIEFPVCPWLPPPQPKWSYASAFDALMYATCFSGSTGGTIVDGPGACESRWPGMRKRIAGRLHSHAFR